MTFVTFILMNGMLASKAESLLEMFIYDLYYFFCVNILLRNAFMSSPVSRNQDPGSRVKRQMS